MANEPNGRRAAGPDVERCRVAHCWFNPETYELLELEAERRGTHPDRLAAHVLGLALHRGLVDEILDR